MMLLNALSLPRPTPTRQMWQVVQCDAVHPAYIWRKCPLVFCGTSNALPP